MDNEKYRVVADSMGEINIPADRLWGASTQRSLENFKIGEEKMPIGIIRAIAIIKKAAAAANQRLGVIDADTAGAIAAAADRILSGELDGEFPLSVWQTGSGTQTNMNVNEVIASITGLHPNDDVNCGQSSNDVFPSAIHIAAVCAVESELLPALDDLRLVFERLSGETLDIIKIGRTHLQDATPLRLGREIGAWATMLGESCEMILTSLGPARKLALGGTAVGTGINCHPDFGVLAAQLISDYTGVEFESAADKVHAVSGRDAIANLHGSIKTAAVGLFKIANDIRLLASGPRCGIGELVIPANEPGSSIMPGKVNPTQCEALAMTCVQVMGNDVAVGFAAANGNLQLNTYMPLIANSTLQSIRLLTDATRSFTDRCASGIRPDTDVIALHLQDSLMLATALSPEIGYDKAARIAVYAHENGLTLREAAIKLGLIDIERFDELTRPENMV